MKNGLKKSIIPASIGLALYLPSLNSAERFVNKEPNALWDALQQTLGRTLLIGSGLYYLGHRKNLVEISIVSSLGIELMAVAYFRFLKK